MKKVSSAICILIILIISSCSGELKTTEDFIKAMPEEMLPEFLKTNSFFISGKNIPANYSKETDTINECTIYYDKTGTMSVSCLTVKIFKGQDNSNYILFAELHTSTRKNENGMFYKYNLKVIKHSGNNFNDVTNTVLPPEILSLENTDEMIVPLVRKDNLLFDDTGFSVSLFWDNQKFVRTTDLPDNFGKKNIVIKEEKTDQTEFEEFLTDFSAELQMPDSASFLLFHLVIVPSVYCVDYTNTTGGIRCENLPTFPDISSTLRGDDIPSKLESKNYEISDKLTYFLDSQLPDDNYSGIYSVLLTSSGKKIELVFVKYDSMYKFCGIAIKLPGE